jgi:hypothetical protein
MIHSKEPQTDGSFGNGPGKRSWTQRQMTLTLATWNTWKAKDEMVTELGGGPEGYAGQMVVGEGAE